MGNFLEKFKSSSVKAKQAIKGRLLKNSEAMLDVMAKNVKAARSCPFLMGQKCIGEFCEHFMELETINEETGEKFKFYRCAHIQTPIMLMEMNSNIIRLQHLIEELLKK